MHSTLCFFFSSRFIITDKTRCIKIKKNIEWNQSIFLIFLDNKPLLSGKLNDFTRIRSLFIKGDYVLSEVIGANIVITLSKTFSVNPPNFPFSVTITCSNRIILYLTYLFLNMIIIKKICQFPWLRFCLMHFRWVL